jgi:predicted phage terminase large subunit-like protein
MSTSRATAARSATAPDATAPEPADIELRPHPGAQETFLATSADIAIYGGAAGGGKSWAILLEPLRHIGNRDFGAVIFRRTSPQIMNEGGLWDESQKIYPLVDARPLSSQPPYWKFPSGATVSFAHLQRETDVLGWQGSQIALIVFDELTHFTESQFWYMLSRSRSTCGIHPYVRATTNPDPDSFVAKLIEWWIDQDTGYAIPERSGVIRWFVRVNDELHWADTKAELVERFPTALPKSFTFVAATLEDNPTLLEKDPGYRANIEALGLVERERLGRGNWRIRATAGTVFNRDWFPIVPAAPHGGLWVRFWDKAGTEGGGDHTAGALVTMVDGITYIVDMQRFQHAAGARDAKIRQTAELDRELVKRHEGRLHIGSAQDPGQAGKSDLQSFVRLLNGFSVFRQQETGSKLTRANPLAAQAYHGNVRVVAGPWVEAFLAEAHRFTGAEGGVDDQVDATAHGFNWLTVQPGTAKKQTKGEVTPTPATGTPDTTTTDIG